MDNNKVWSEGEYAYMRNDEGKLWRRKLDMLHFIYYPWELVEESEDIE